MKVEKLEFMNVPQVSENRDSGVKMILPEDVDNLESSVDSENVVISPVERRALKDSKINREHRKDVFSELSERAVVSKRKDERLDKINVRNIYTANRNVDESFSTLCKKLTLQEFVDYHTNNKYSPIREGRKAVEKDAPIDAAKNVYHLVEKRLFYDSNDEIIHDIPLGDVEVRSICRKDFTTDRYFAISSRSPRYSENSEVIQDPRFHMGEYDIGIVVPSEDDCALAKNMADLLGLKYEQYELTEDQKKGYPVSKRGEIIYPASYICIVKMKKTEAESNLAWWAYSHEGIELPIKYIDKAIKELPKDEQAILKDEFNLSDMPKKPRKPRSKPNVDK